MATRRLGGAAALLVIGLVLVTVVAIYLRWGWWRMEDACRAQNDQRGVEYGWSWGPPGFECRFSDGEARVMLWP